MCVVVVRYISCLLIPIWMRSLNSMRKIDTHSQSVSFIHCMYIQSVLGLLILYVIQLPCSICHVHCMHSAVRQSIYTHYFRFMLAQAA